MTIDEYVKVKTGEDLVKLGVVPKDSSKHLALITLLRLKSLHDELETSIDETILGSWIPLVEYNRLTTTQANNVDYIMEHAENGSTVRGKGEYENEKFDGKSGIIRMVDQSRKLLSVEWDSPPVSGHNLNGLITNSARLKHGYRVPPQNVTLILPSEVVAEETFSLAKGVVCDEKMGHKIKFNQVYQGKLENKLEIPVGTTGMIVEYRPKEKPKEGGVVKIKLDKNIPNQGNTRNFEFYVNSLYDSKKNVPYVLVSNRGQIFPLDKEKEIWKNALLDLFPRTVLNQAETEKIILGIFMGKDMILEGPPGSGKSNTAKDIIAIAQLQEVTFHVENCNVQCNPFSLFDEKFSKEVPACPECLISYDPNFRNTGRFTLPKAKDVLVTVAKYGEGHGIEYAEGTSGMSRMHLAGFKLPKIGEEAKDQNEYDPEGFHPGLLPRTNNGILHLDEMDKLRPQALDDLLEALNSGRIKPDQLRYTYPARATIIGTANDVSKFSGPITDRALIVTIPYSDDPDVSYKITRRAYHGETVDLSLSKIHDTHRMKWNEIRSIPMPTIVERAVDAVFRKFDTEFKGKKSDITTSNRCKFDALDAARAKLVLDEIFFKDTPNIVTMQYAMDGLSYAMCSRVQDGGRNSAAKVHEDIRTWITENFDKVLKGEEDVWWCRVYKDISIAKTIISTIEDSFVSEIARYEKDYRNVFEPYKKVKFARENPQNSRAQIAISENPFIDKLFEEQPGMEKVSEAELGDLIDYFMKSKQNTTCKIG